MQGCHKKLTAYQLTFGYRSTVHFVPIKSILKEDMNIVLDHDRKLT